MRYIMFVCVDPDHTAEDAAAAPDIETWGSSVEPNWVIGDRLRPPADARTVRVRGGERLVTDGPFTESKEWIAGFDVLECDTIEQAHRHRGRAPDGVRRADRGARLLAARRRATGAEA